MCKWYVLFVVIGIIFAPVASADAGLYFEVPEGINNFEGEEDVKVVINWDLKIKGFEKVTGTSTSTVFAGTAANALDFAGDVADSIVKKVGPGTAGVECLGPPINPVCRVIFPPETAEISIEEGTTPGIISKGTNAVNQQGQVIGGFGIEPDTDTGIDTLLEAGSIDVVGPGVSPISRTYPVGTGIDNILDDLEVEMDLAGYNVQRRDSLLWFSTSTPGDVIFNVTGDPLTYFLLIPEPSTVWLLLFGIALAPRGLSPRRSGSLLCCARREAEY